jgi:coenzyme F420 hydrogenase subunit beta
MGCGACAALCPGKAITLIDVPARGIRPKVDSARCQHCGQCVKLCPGIELSHQPFNSETIPALRRAWGPVLEVWEGYATDPEIRYKASSGGVATALALFCLEKQQASAVLQIGASSEAPLRNVPVFSRTRDELLACTGSRYAPAATCSQLQEIAEARTPCVFVGKPCDIAALRKSQTNNEQIKKNVILAISIFCAGTPTSNGTYALLDSLGVSQDQVKNLRYRGWGWPGVTTVEVKASDNDQRQMSYEQSWGNILSKHSQFRCRLCPDSTGEFADISCGDPWYRDIEPDEPGRSLVLARTEHGRKVLRQAMDSKYIELEKVRPEVLPASQRALLKKRQNLFGRLLSMRTLLVPTPQFSGFSLAANWRLLGWRERLRSIAGTLRRIVVRGLFRPEKWVNTDRSVKINSKKSALRSP